MNAHQTRAITALERMKGDDVARARQAFRGLSMEQMREPHGHSGKTRQEVLADYENATNLIDQTIAWIRNQTNGR